jgi:glutamyl-tRNA synthetase
MSPNVRVRFAPSPTGYLHVGGARTALFNWLFARHCGGSFILRIEDTDKARNTQQAVQVILEGLRWLGLQWDEGPEIGGPRGPYFQSEREAIYQAHFDQLHAQGHLYQDQGAWRFRSLRQKITVHDLICGDIEFDLSNPDTHPDMTIRRPDGSWIFHFVNVVDDIEMQISHVIRGEDHLSNTPKHLELFKALGKTPPRYAHIPLILNKDGSKMSKRDAGSSITSYLEEGYLPDAVRNYLSLLGWSPKDNREILSLEETVRLFDLEKINRKNAHFDLEKCLWLNSQYILQTPPERFLQLALPFLQKTGLPLPELPALAAILALVREKTKQLTDLPELTSFFFTEDYPLDPTAHAKALTAPNTASRLQTLASHFQANPSWDAASIELSLKAAASQLGCKPGELVLPTRVAVSGRPSGPSLYPMLEVLGRDRTLARLSHTVQTRCSPTL